MNFKERFLTVMNHEEPDQVPVMGLIMDPATVNNILGKKSADLVGMLQKPVLGDQIQHLLSSNRFWTNMFYGNFSGRWRRLPNSASTPTGPYLLS